MVSQNRDSQELFFFLSMVVFHSEVTAQCGLKLNALAHL